MIGAWDTVGALGIPLRGFRSLTHARYQFHDTELSGIVQLACHALAIDEHRAPFAPTLWTYKAKTGQQVEQVWFCGAHSDIGGGYAETALSDIALDWMLGKARGAGLAFDSQAMAAYPLHGNPLGKLHDSKTGLYRLTPGIDRVIGSDPTQSLQPVGPAALGRRWLLSAPLRLRNYFKRNIAPLQPSARQTSEPPEASSISDTARSSRSREILRNSRRAALMPSSAAGTTASAAHHTCGSSSSPVTRNAAARSEMLVSVAKPMVARNCSLVSPRCER